MTASQPNIVLVIADDHRADAFSRCGARVPTPHLDALAARGIDFTNAYCHGGFNPAVCVPSRATLMTGRSVFELSPPEQRNRDDCSAGFTIPPEYPTLPEKLRSAGYHTHAIGKWHNDKASFARSFASAQAISFHGMGAHDRMMLQDHDPDGVYDDAREAHVQGFSTDIFKDAALDFLSGDRAEPFFLYLALTAPHDPRTPLRQYQIDPETLDLPPSFLPVHPFDTGAATLRDEMLAGFPRKPDEIRTHLADYYGMIAHIDAAFGQIVSAVSERFPNTIVIYTSDHGLCIGDHGLMGKQSLYDAAIGIPLLMAGPGIEPDRRDALVWHADTRRTILSRAGIDARGEESDAIDLLHERADREHITAFYCDTQRMIRDDRFKYIGYARGAGGQGSETEQLFDLLKDPNETANLAFVPDYQTKKAELVDALKNWERAKAQSC